MDACREWHEQGRRLSRCSDSEFDLCAVDVVFDGARRDAEYKADVREGFALLCERQALPLAAGQMNARKEVY